MQRNVGIWIDHKKALVVQLENGKKNLQVIESHVEPRTRFSRRGAGSEDMPSELHLNQRYEEHLKAYYERVTELLKTADSILIMGPGEAKLELERVLRKSKTVSNRIAAVETIDKMTQKQITARVSSFFTKQ